MGYTGVRRLKKAKRDYWGYTEITAGNSHHPYI
jgi:hypothetical protein